MEGAQTCITCGHCIAVCPEDAVLYKTEETEHVLEFDSDLNKSSDILSSDQLMTLLRMRRSVRRFKDEPLSNNEISTVLDAMRYAPTAKNLQALHFIVLTDRSVISLLAEKIISFLRMTMRVSDTPGVGWLFRALIKDARLLKDRLVKEDMNRLFEGMEKGVDELFYDAPALIIAHTRDPLGVGCSETGIAFAQASLMAEVLGLGTCWIGYAQKALKNSGGARKVVGIPSGHNATGVLAIGHPDVKYFRAPSREPVRE
jgi:nitroreductase